MLRLSRKMLFVTFLKTSKIVTFPSVWHDFHHFHSHTLSPKITFYLRLLTKTEPSKQPCNCKSQCKCDSTPLKHHSEAANPNVTATQLRHFHETLRLCSEIHHLSCKMYHFHANHNGILRALPNGRAIALGFEHLRTVAVGCEQLRTVANSKTTSGIHSCIPSDSQVKREPFATHSGKMKGKQVWLIALLQHRPKLG